MEYTVFYVHIYGRSTDTQSFKTQMLINFANKAQMFINFVNKAQMFINFVKCICQLHRHDLGAESSA